MDENTPKKEALDLLFENEAKEELLQELKDELNPETELISTHNSKHALTTDNVADKPFSTNEEINIISNVNSKKFVDKELES